MTETEVVLGHWSVKTLFTTKVADKSFYSLGL